MKIIFSETDSKELISFSNPLSDKNLFDTINLYVWSIFNAKKCSEESFELDVRVKVDGIKEKKVSSFIEYTECIKDVFGSKPFSVFIYHDFFRIATEYFSYNEDWKNYSGVYDPMGEFGFVSSLADILSDYKDIEGFSYKYIDFGGGDGTMRVKTISDGEINGYIKNMNPDNIQEDDKIKWYNNASIILDAEFDVEENPDLIEILHETVRKYISEEEMTYCEDEWEEDPNRLLAGVYWAPDKMNEIREFIDELNYINQSVGGIIKFIPAGMVWIAEDEFSVAQVIEDEGELFLVGTKF